MSIFAARGEYFGVLTFFVCARLAAARKAKQLAKLLAAAPPDPIDSTEWCRVENDIFFAFAADGIGHHDGEREYIVDVPPEEFGGRFIPGGQARWTDVNGGPTDPIIHALPSQLPPPGGVVRFRLRVCPEGAMGRLVIVGGLEVRATPA